MAEKIEIPVEKRLKAWHNEEWHTSKGRIIRDIVYALDTGLVTTVSFIAGISMSLVTKEKIIIASLIEIVSGTIAIFFGSFISTRAQKHFFENQIDFERKEIELNPKKETEEIRVIFNEMGFDKEEQEVAVKRITANKDLWLKFMIQEEIGVNPGFIDNPFEIGIVSALSFVIGACPTIIPFFIFHSMNTALIIGASFVLTFLFIVGVFKSRITKVRWYISGLETLVIGIISCGTGILLGRIIGRYSH
jgi:VIT1/CCC1 family predicted Fe2+/Mn2+ transporter